MPAVQVAYRFVSVLNEQGFIEGRYVPVLDGVPVASSAAAALAVPPSSPGDDSSEASEEKPVATEGGTKAAPVDTTMGPA